MQPKALFADTAWQRLLSRDATLLIESVFRHTLNLISEQTGERYTLFLEKGYNAPRAMTVTSLQPVKAGDTVYITGGEMILNNTTVHTKQCKFMANTISEQGRPASTRIVTLQQWLKVYAVEGSFYDPLSGDAVSEVIVAKLAAARQLFVQAMRDGRDVDIAVKGLVGLGIGLTPSGDDYLVGWLAIIRQTRMFGEHGHIGLTMAIQEQLHRTTAVSQMYLKEALLGQFAEPIRKLCQAVSGGSDEQIELAAQTLFEHGATSGQDSIVGMIDALSVYKHKERIHEI